MKSKIQSTLYGWIRKHWSYAGQTILQSLLLGLLFRILLMHNKFNKLFKEHDDCYKTNIIRSDCDNRLRRQMLIRSDTNFSSWVSDVTYYTIKYFYKGDKK